MDMYTVLKIFREREYVTQYSIPLIHPYSSIKTDPYTELCVRNFFMFTGIIKHIATVHDIQTHAQTSERRLTLKIYQKLPTITIGDSLACNGICLTLVEITSLDAHHTLLSFQASSETVHKTTLKDWQIHTRINLERSVCLGERLDGHLVFGHVDDTVVCRSNTLYGLSRRMVFEIPPAYEPYVVPKGSLALNGVSLTVNHVKNTLFDVIVVPHTLTCTNLCDLTCGDAINFEVDMLARYVHKRLSLANVSQS